MKKNSQEPVKIVMSFKASNPEKDSLNANIVTATVTEGKLAKLEENTTIVRRYSFDDNGGGYLGL